MTHFNHLIANCEVVSPLSANASDDDVQAGLTGLLQSLPTKLKTGDTSTLTITTAFMSMEELYDAGAIMLHVLIRRVLMHCVLSHVRCSF